MYDATGKKLLRLLEPEHPAALRRSALVVLGEVGARDRQLADALCSVLADPDPELRSEALQLVGKLRIDRALPQLLERVAAGGPESEVAARAAAQLGPKGIGGLQELMAKTAPGLRRRIAGALAAGGTPGAESAAIATLLDSDPGVTDAATRTLLTQIRTLGARERRQVADQVLELLKPKKKLKLAQHSEAALLRVLAATGDARAEANYWARVGPAYSPVLRAEALQALGSLAPPAGAAALRRLVACASDPDFRVVAPALMLLKKMGSARNTQEWLLLLQAPDVAARRFALERLAGQDSAEVAAALLQQLEHPERGLQDQALAALAQLEHGRQALAGQLLEADTPDEAWRLARAQAAFFKDYTPALKTKVLQQACAFLERDDRRSDALLFLLRQTDAAKLRDQLGARALALRKKKQYPAALHYLRLLAHDPAFPEELRFELAACGLKLSAKDVAPAARATDPALHQFGRLVNNHDTPPVKYLEKAKWLGPLELFYLGFHFVEGNGALRDFGSDVLKLLLKQSPRSTLARAARAKLKSLA